MSKISKQKGLSGFDEHYGAIYGSRWAELRESLLAPVRQVARQNRFANPKVFEERSVTQPLADFAGSTAYLIEPGQKWTPKLDSQGVLDTYVMDAASIFAAAALAPQPGEEILDLCAAPGGKSLVLAEHLNDFSHNRPSRLVSNEISDRRRARLRAVVEDYVPVQKRELVHVTGHDGARWCLHQTDAFDRILIDAPCSGERHLLADPGEMKLWSAARSRNLAVRQYALLASALAVVKHGGRLVYSTCSISPTENDQVIARLLKKRAGEAEVLKPRFEIGESTEHGWMILPDATGYGPIYVAILERSDLSQSET
jgi:16S rRNA C967 or C1407 C5-methylase (RsmB/RsmF family)